MAPSSGAVGVAAPSAAMTMENSPRAMSTVPARSRPGPPAKGRAATSRPRPCRRCRPRRTQWPGRARRRDRWGRRRTRRTGRTSRRTGRGVDRRSVDAVPAQGRRARARRGTRRWPPTPGPRSASPPTRSVSPNTESSSASSEAGASRRLRRWPHRSATVRITVTARRAMAIVAAVVGPGLAGNDGADDGQVHRHGEVFDDQQVEHCGGLSVAETVKVGQRLGRRCPRSSPSTRHRGARQRQAPSRARCRR